MHTVNKFHCTMLRLVTLLVFLTGVFSQVTRNGTCNFTNITAVRDLNVTQLSGDWYQIRRIKNSQECGTCSTTRINATYTNNSLSEITISNKEVFDKAVNHKNGTLTLNNEVKGKFFTKYQDISYDSIILATNYTNYAILYSCKNINNATKNVWAWVLSRNATLNKNENDVIKSIISSNEDLKNATWTKPKHTKKACDPNSTATFGLSPILTIFAILILGKDIFGIKEV